MMDQQSKRFVWASPVLSHRPRALALAVGLTVASAGCVVPLPAKAKVDRTGELSSRSGGVVLSVVFSHDFAPETPENTGRDIVNCVTRGIAEAVPDARLMSSGEFHRAIFAVEAGEVLLRLDTIGVLFGRDDVKQRVQRIGLTHLILVGGATHRDIELGVAPVIPLGHPGLGATLAGPAWAAGKRHTRFAASIIDVIAVTEVAGVQASAEGRQFAFIFPLMVGWYGATESSSCEALGAEVARALARKHHDESR